MRASEHKIYQNKDRELRYLCFFDAFMNDEAKYIAWVRISQCCCFLPAFRTAIAAIIAFANTIILFLSLRKLFWIDGCSTNFFRDINEPDAIVKIAYAVSLGRNKTFFLKLYFVQKQLLYFLMQSYTLLLLSLFQFFNVCTIIAQCTRCLFAPLCFVLEPDVRYFVHILINLLVFYFFVRICIVFPSLLQFFSNFIFNVWPQLLANFYFLIPPIRIWK